MSNKKTKTVVQESKPKKNVAPKSKQMRASKAVKVAGAYMKMANRSYHAIIKSMIEADSIYKTFGRLVIGK